MADAWEDMTDVQRASALELMGGKRQANVLSALIQNFDTVEKVIETSANSSGSALQENERYLDSIQGKVDQFNNAVQAMWNNALSSDVVKIFVEFGTALIKILDSLGPINLALTGMGMYLTRGIDFTSAFKPAEESLDRMRRTLKDLEKEKTAAEKAFDKSPTEKNDKKREEITKRYSEYETRVKEAEALDEVNKRAKERIELQNKLDEATKKYKEGRELLGGQDQDGSAAIQASDEISQLNDQIKENGMSLDEANAKMKALGDTAEATGKRGSRGLKAIGQGAKAAWKQVKQLAAQLAISMAITAVFDAISNIGAALAPLFDNMDQSAEGLQDKLSELKNDLSSVENELTNLRSELTTTDKRIEELMSQGSLSFVEQEELSKLKSVSAELESQIKLQETLQESLQKSVNSTSVQATNAYLDTSFMSEQSKSERQEKGGEKGAGIGQIIGTAVGALGFFGGPLLGAALMGVGSTVGGMVGKWIGEATVGAVYDSEQSVEEAMDNMLEERGSLLQKQKEALTSKDAGAYNEATEALRTYDAQMAQHISQIQQNYNAMDWATASPEDRKEMMEYADWLDKYNISMGTAGAKSNAIARIFGDEAEAGFAEAKAQIDTLKKNLAEARDSGEGVDEALAALADFKLELSPDEVARLREMGIYIYEAEDYFKDVIKTEAEFIDGDLEDVAKDIEKITDGLGSLQSAFEEVIEDGVLTAKTVMTLKEELQLDKYSDVEDVTDAWRTYLDVMMSGVATTEDMTVATQNLAKELMDAALASDNGLTPDNKGEYIAQLRSLGVNNAEEYVNDLLQKDMVTEIEGKLDYISNDDIDDIAKRYEVESDAITKIITKLNERKSAEAEVKKVQDEQKNYYNWYDGDGENKGIQPLAEDISEFENNSYYSRAKLIKETMEQGGDIRALGIENSFWKGYNFNGTWYDTYQDLVAAIDADISRGEQELGALKQKYKSLFDEGVAKGWIDEDGNMLVQEFDKDIADWQAKIKSIEDDIDENLTVSVDLELDLQDKDKLVDDIQSVYDELANAQKEYAENGYVSVDTMQSLLKLEPKYLDMLVDEEGKLNLDKQALQDVARARIIDLGIKQQTAIYDNALALASEGSKNALLEEISAMETATTVAEDWNDQQEEMIINKLKQRVLDGDITQVEADGFIAGIRNQIAAIQTVTNSALDNLGNSLSSSGNTAIQESNDAFQDAMDYWENRIGAEESRFQQIQNEIDKLESKGKKAGAGYYNRQIQSEKDKLSLLMQQQDELKNYIGYVDEAGNEVAGIFEEGSDEWWNAANEWNSLQNEIDQVTLSIQDLNDAMADTHWYVFDEAHERASTLASDLENIRNILSNEKLFDDEGNFTKEGLGYLASYVSDLGVFEGALANAKAEMELFGDSYDPDKKYVDAQGNDLSIDSEQDWYDAAKKAEEKYDDWNSKVIETKYNIKDLYEQQIDAVEEYTQTLVENYNEYIDAVKEALDSERDLYEFKKSTEKKSKDMAAIERRIASLSGSTNAADIAERRKLQAELTEAKSDMDDHYYSHAKEQQSLALDNEMTAYETAMNAYIEGLRAKLEESTAELYLSYEEMGADTKSFIDGVTQSVILNAGNVLEVYSNTGETINTALTQPFVDAAEKIGWFASSDEALGLMNSWTQNKSGAVFYDFQSEASKYLQEPWTSDDLTSAISGFQTSLGGTMTSIVQDVNTNVSNIISHLQTEIDKIKDTNIRINVDYETNGDPSGAGDVTIIPGGGGGSSALGFTMSLNAKGTLGTKKDGFALTDESWIGEEITLAAGKNGQLQYLKKGSAVMPADISANLVEWGKINPNMLNLGTASNVNMITNAINKPELNISFESLVKAENITEETLPAIKKLVAQELNRFTKELNYALKGKGAR